MLDIIFYALFFLILYTGLYFAKKYLNKKIIRFEDLEDDTMLS